MHVPVYNAQHVSLTETAFSRRMMGAFLAHKPTAMLKRFPSSRKTLYPGRATRRQIRKN
jgi:hypothetical protein